MNWGRSHLFKNIDNIKQKATNLICVITAKVITSKSEIILLLSIKILEGEEFLSF